MEKSVDLCTMILHSDEVRKYVKKRYLHLFLCSYAYRKCFREKESMFGGVKKFFSCVCNREDHGALLTVIQQFHGAGYGRR